MALDLSKWSMDDDRQRQLRARTEDREGAPNQQTISAALAAAFQGDDPKDPIIRGCHKVGLATWFLLSHIFKFSVIVMYRYFITDFYTFEDNSFLYELCTSNFLFPSSKR